MNSLQKVFNNFKDFYSEINGATLTGAIDVIVVEQPDGEFLCSPFHVRFGKLGVLRSREKVVDIEINGDAVDIHMKLGESGEAFFVEECPEEVIDDLPKNLATSPIPNSFYQHKFGAIDAAHDDDDEEKANGGTLMIKTASDDLPLPMPLPRRNSIDLSTKETAITAVEGTPSKFENQVSDFSHRRHTDNVLERRNLNEKLKEYTTQKLRQEWAEREEIFQFDAIEKEKEWSNSTQTDDQQPAVAATVSENNEDKQPAAEVAVAAVEAGSVSAEVAGASADAGAANANKDDWNKSGKKKRRKKSQMKKKNAQRKSSSSSSLGSNAALEGATIGAEVSGAGGEDGDTISQHSISMSGTAAHNTADTSGSNNKNNQKNTNSSSSNDESTPKSNDAQLHSAGSPLLLGARRDDKTLSSSNEACLTASRLAELDIHFFSDTEVTSSGGGGIVGRPSTPIQSDSELEISLREKDADVERLSQSASWKWGELPTPEKSESKDAGGMGAGSGVGGSATQAQRNSRLSGMFSFMKKTNKMRNQAVSADGGIYLSDLDAEGMDPAMVAMYFPTAVSPARAAAALAQEMRPSQASRAVVAGDEGAVTLLAEDDRESGNGTSLPHSPSSMEGQKSIDSDYEDGKPGSDAKYLDFVAMSLCGLPEKGNVLSDEEFERQRIKYADVCENVDLFASPNLVVRFNGRYYSWAAACRVIMTIIAFQQPLTAAGMEHLILHGKGEGGSDASALKHDATVEGVAIGEGVPSTAQAKRSWWNWRRSQSGAGAGVAPANISGKAGKMPGSDDRDGPELALAAAAVGTQTTRPNSPDISDNTLSKTDSTLNAENTSAMVENMDELSMASSEMAAQERSKTASDGSNCIELIGKHERYMKTLRLSSEAIKKLSLKEGMNEMEFSVTTAYQGTTRCKCQLFRWRHDDKVVISDIDGTITKSDVLGHILPMVGKDWAQLGVAQLFSKIEQNGYKLLYLSARAIGQSRATREYLRSIRQGNTQLPDGPLLLNPTSLISALHREVIERKPEQFKIACLSDIRDLFPDKDPFYAGYGNRINDVWAYRAVGIPIMRIFTINTKGELKHELTQTFQSSYCSMTCIVDQLFPPRIIDQGSIEYSNFNYWRDPIPDIDVAIDLDRSLSAVATTSAVGAGATTSGGAGPASTSAAGPAANTSSSTSIELSKPLSTIHEN